MRLVEAWFGRILGAALGVVAGAADRRGEMPASPPPLSLSLLGSDARGEIAAACAVVPLHRLRRVSRSWHLVADPELSRRLELLPSELRMTHAERAALVAKHAKDVVEYVIDRRKTKSTNKATTHKQQGGKNGWLE